jgi:hypothetical protein
MTDLADALFSIGEYVEKSIGDAHYKGYVVAVYRTRANKIRYVVEVDPQGFQMICSAAQLRVSETRPTKGNAA